MSTVNARKGSAGYPASAGHHDFVLTAAVDFSDLLDSTGAAYTPTSGDILQILDIPAGTVVEDVFLKVDTVMGAAGTAAVGDATDDDGYMTTSDLNTLGWTVTNGAYFWGSDADVTGAFVNKKGKLYSSAGVLALKFGGTLAALGIVQVYVKCFRLSDQA